MAYIIFQKFFYIQQLFGNAYYPTVKMINNLDTRGLKSKSEIHDANKTQ